jgi:hypothetical protein
VLQAAVEREWPHTKSVLATPQSGVSTISAAACGTKRNDVMLQAAVEGY